MLINKRSVLIKIKFSLSQHVIRARRSKHVVQKNSINHWVKRLSLSKERSGKIKSQGWLVFVFEEKANRILELPTLCIWRSAPSDVGFAKDYKFRANSPPGADTWITGGSGCGPWCGLKEAFRNVSKKFSLCLMTIVHYIQCFQCCLGCFELHKKQKVKFPMLSEKVTFPCITGCGERGPWCGLKEDCRIQLELTLDVSKIALHAFDIFFKSLISHFNIWIKLK